MYLHRYPRSVLHMNNSDARLGQEIELLLPGKLVLPRERKKGIAQVLQTGIGYMLRGKKETNLEEQEASGNALPLIPDYS